MKQQQSIGTCCNFGWTIQRTLIIWFLLQMVKENCNKCLCNRRYKSVDLGWIIIASLTFGTLTVFSRFYWMRAIKEYATQNLERLLSIKCVRIIEWVGCYSDLFWFVQNSETLTNLQQFPVELESLPWTMLSLAARLHGPSYLTAGLLPMTTGNPFKFVSKMLSFCNPKYLPVIWTVHTIQLY